MLHINYKIIIRIVAYSPLVFIPLIVFIIAFMSIKMLKNVQTVRGYYLAEPKLEIKLS